MDSSLPRVLVHEYITGGGWPEPELPPGLAGEGLAMLRAVLEDFSAWGGAIVTTTRDSRLSDVPLAADRIIDINHHNYDSAMEKAAAGLDAALIIAPETDGILACVSALMLDSGVHLLGSSPDAVATAADKWTCHRLFTEAGLATPDSWLLDMDKVDEFLESIDKSPAAKPMAANPLVVKPRDGVGCEGVHLIASLPPFQSVLEDNKANHQVILQEYIQGNHISACLLVSDRDTVCLSLNEQWVEIGSPCKYLGGETPYIGPGREKAVDLAKRAAALVPGLRGYIGVDMVATEDRCYLIEINPRITYSYVGLRQVVNINMAEAIWKAAIHQILPRDIILTGRAVFRKDDENG